MRWFWFIPVALVAAACVIALVASRIAAHATAAAAASQGVFEARVDDAAEVARDLNATSERFGEPQ